METLQLSTDIHCEKCVEKLAPHLDSVSEIDSWEFDLSDPAKSLKVTGKGINVDKISALMQTEGYKLLDVAAHSNFWADIKKWKRASFNTLSCLIGCSIGDFGVILFLQAYYPQTSMTVQMILAVIAGLLTSISLETVLLRVREKFAWISALKTAFGMSFISMVGMEIAMNTTDFMITGGKAAFNDHMYWIALIVALVAGFVAPLPYNYYKLKKFSKACH